MLVAILVVLSPLLLMGLALAMAELELRVAISHVHDEMTLLLRHGDADELEALVASQLRAPVEAAWARQR